MTNLLRRQKENCGQQKEIKISHAKNHQDMSVYSKCDCVLMYTQLVVMSQTLQMRMLKGFCVEYLEGRH